MSENGSHFEKDSDGLSWQSSRLGMTRSTDAITFLEMFRGKDAPAIDLKNSVVARHREQSPSVTPRG